MRARARHRRPAREADAPGPAPYAVPLRPAGRARGFGGPAPDSNPLGTAPTRDDQDKTPGPAANEDAAPPAALATPDPDAAPDEAQPLQNTPAPVPKRVDLNVAVPVPVPPTGPGRVQATADVAGVTWSLQADSVAVDPKTTISSTGAVSIGAGQAPGTIDVVATNVDGASASMSLAFSAHPTGIDSTTLVKDAGAGSYGHFFDHVLKSSSGTVADLDGIPVGEKFPGLATPDAADHLIKNPAFPFADEFTLVTATLTADASNNWFLTSGGMLGGSNDEVTIEQSGINVGRFVASASNKTPPGALPQGFTVEQHLHWYNPLAGAAARWTDFKTVKHRRELKLVGTDLKFMTTVNGKDDGGDAYAGEVAPHALKATPASVAHSAAAPPGGAAAPKANTVALAVTTLPATLPSGASLSWSIEGTDLGCVVTPDPSDAHRATLTIGTQAGTVTVRVADSAGNNYDEVTVKIT